MTHYVVRTDRHIILLWNFCKYDLFLLRKESDAPLLEQIDLDWSDF